MMTEAGLKLECLRLAIDLKKADGDRSPEGIAELTKVFYTLVSSDSNVESVVEKQRRGRRSKEEELFS